MRTLNIATMPEAAGAFPKPPVSLRDRIQHPVRDLSHSQAALCARSRSGPQQSGDLPDTHESFASPFTLGYASQVRRQPGTADSGSAAEEKNLFLLVNTRQNKHNCISLAVMMWATSPTVQRPNPRYPSPPRPFSCCQFCETDPSSFALNSIQEKAS